MELTLDELKNEIKNSNVPLLIEFWASWCSPCQMMKPLIDEFAQEINSRIKVLKINVDKNPAAQDFFNIQGMPTFIYIKSGEEIKRGIGAKTKSELFDLIHENNSENIKSPVILG